MVLRLAWPKMSWIRYVRTIEQLLAGQHFEHPPANVTLAQAERVTEEGQQDVLF